MKKNDFTRQFQIISEKVFHSTGRWIFPQYFYCTQIRKNCCVLVIGIVKVSRLPPTLV